MKPGIAGGTIRASHAECGRRKLDQDNDLLGNFGTFYLDASASYNVTDYMKVMLEATNLTDERTVSTGVNFKF